MPEETLKNTRNTSNPKHKKNHKNIVRMQNQNLSNQHLTNPEETENVKKTSH